MSAIPCFKCGYCLDGYNTLRECVPFANHFNGKPISLQCCPPVVGFGELQRVTSQVVGVHPEEPGVWDVTNVMEHLFLI